MIEQIYLRNLSEMMEDLEKLDFPIFVKELRKIMGLFQYKAAVYLGIPHSRLKKIEMGIYAVAIEEWELQKMHAFFKVPLELLDRKEQEWLRKKKAKPSNISARLWMKKS